MPDLTHCTGFSFASKGWHQLGVRGYSVENHGVFFHISSLPMPVDNSKRNTMMALFLAHPTALSPEKITDYCAILMLGTDTSFKSQIPTW